MTVLSVTLAAILALFMVKLLATYRLRHLRAADRLQDQFYRAAFILAADEGTPQPILALLAQMSQEIHSRALMWRLVVFLLSGKGRRCKDGEEILAASVRELRPELQGHFWMALISGVMRITYNNVLLGTFVRRVTLLGIDLQSRARAQRESAQVERIAVGLFDANHHCHA